jgi:hypothetical protein
VLLVGVLLLLIVVLILAGLVSGAGGAAAADFYGLVLPDASARTLVLAGFVLGLLAAAGWSLVASAGRRLRRTGKLPAPAPDTDTDEDAARVREPTGDPDRDPAAPNAPAASG